MVRWDGTTTLAVVRVESLPIDVSMPKAHDLALKEAPAREAAAKGTPPIPVLADIHG